MAEINFPTSPTLNQVFFSGSKGWIWSGTAWNLLSYSLVGAAGRSANAGQWSLANPDYLEPPGFSYYSYDTSQTASSNTLNISGYATSSAFWNTWLEIVDAPFQVLLTTDNISALTNYQIFDVSGASSFVLASPSTNSYYRVPVTLNSTGGTGTTGFASLAVVYIFFLQAEGPTGATGPSGQWDTAQTIDNKTASYTLVTADAGKLITMTVATANDLTVDGSLNLSVGQRIDIAQMGAGQTTVVASGTTVVATPTLKLRTQYSSASLICTAADTYLLVGDLAVS